MISAVRDEAARLCGFSNMTRDLTERIRADAEQRHLTSVLEHERAVLQTLSESFLGKTPRLRGLQVASLYQPAAKADRVGGDYFDFIPLDRRRLGVVIGDVCGKGLSASLYTAMAKYTLRAYAREEAEPEQVLYRLNQTLAAEIDDDERFVTLVYGVLDLEAATFTYANAGHPGPVLYDPTTHSCQQLGATGGVIGAFPDWQYEQRTVSLPPGGVLTLFTDGVTEAGGCLDPLDGLDLCAALQGHMAETVDGIARALFDRAQELAGGHLSDDVAIVVIRRPSIR